MEIGDIKNAYRRYAPVYDVVFGPVFRPGRKQIIDALDCRPSDRILEVGVGTGLSLPLYPKNVSVTGIDISPEMLAKANQRVRRSNLNQVEAVMEMDGEKMEFADRSFDKVVAMYVVSVAANPTRLIDEMRRVCKPGGEIFIVNHFCSRNGLISAMERGLAPFAAIAGFHPNIELDDFLHSARLDVVEIHDANVFGYWKVLRCRNQAHAIADPTSLQPEKADCIT